MFFSPQKGKKIVGVTEKVMIDKKNWENVGLINWEKLIALWYI